MRIRLGTLRRVISEQTWMPGRYYPAAEPLNGPDRDRIDQPLGELDGIMVDDELDEVDTDPSNNPGRPADSYEYLGMHPDPKAAMSPPHAGGGGGGEGGGTSDNSDPSKPPDAPTGGPPEGE